MFTLSVSLSTSLLKLCYLLSEQRITDQKTHNHIHSFNSYFLMNLMNLKEQIESSHYNEKYAPRSKASISRITNLISFDITAL